MHVEKGLGLMRDPSLGWLYGTELLVETLSTSPKSTPVSRTSKVLKEKIMTYLEENPDHASIDEILASLNQHHDLSQGISKKFLARKLQLMVSMVKINKIFLF